MYDKKCDELARLFLSDVRKQNDEALVKALAQDIQDAIDGFFAEKGLA